MKYNNLNFEQRYTIECMFKQKIKKTNICKAIGVSESILYRELKRNANSRGCYNAKHAQMLADERAKEGRVKKRFSNSMKNYVVEKLTNYQCLRNKL